MVDQLLLIRSQVADVVLSYIVEMSVCKCPDHSIQVHMLIRCCILARQASDGLHRNIAMS